jgi:CheY-like chemotaxis protein
VIRVLVVEDDERLRAIVCRQLGEHGMEGRGAATGEEGVEEVARWRPDVVVMDLKMPGMGGLAATRAIRRLSGGHPLPPVIVLTAVQEREAIEQAALAGADDYLIKPFRVEALLEKIRRAMARVQDLTPPPKEPAP